MLLCGRMKSLIAYPKAQPKLFGPATPVLRFSAKGLKKRQGDSEILFERGRARNPECVPHFRFREESESLSVDGEGLTTEMLSTFPNLSPTSQYQRRIRCKMCRQQLATHEHMLSHGQPPSDRQPLPNSTSQAPQQDSSSATDLEPASASTPSTNGATIGQQFSESSGSSDEVVDNSDSIGPVRNLRSNSKRNMPPILINPRCSGYFVEPVRRILALHLPRDIPL